MLLLMPKRKARKSLFSSDAARRKSARVEHETEDDRYERLRTARPRLHVDLGYDSPVKRASPASFLILLPSHDVVAM